ncbi:MAG: hypothetical protein FJX68_07640 [Alphaproteobacteria bacterium]|nr:hypothetical protein [Alphaproteobacteria bacterium]
MVGRKLSNASPIVVRQMEDLPWKDAGKPGVHYQEMRYDTQTGRYFGTARFAVGSRSGAHRHLGPGATYMLAGRLTDHHCEAAAGDVLINLDGAVHDVVAYEHSLAVARIDGPVLYPSEDGVLASLGEKARKAGQQVDATLGQQPGIVLKLADLAKRPTGIAGLSRRPIFDYAGQPHQARFVELTLAPGTRVPAHRVGSLTDWFVLSGEVAADGQAAQSAGYVSLQAGAELEIRSRYGCRLLCWADAPVVWADKKARLPDLYGF